MSDDLHRQMATEMLRGMKSTGLASNGPVDIINGTINCVVNGLLFRLNRVAQSMSKRLPVSVLQNADMSLLPHA